jgi:hypothetical protein
LKARERLDAGRGPLHGGRYAEALDHFIWFHNHALAEDDSWRGVRLSYALGNWFDLGQVYPEALRALEDVRDRKTDSLLAGGGSWQDFRDVQAINALLGADTHAVLAGCGNAPEARRIKALALELIQSPSVRKEAQAGLIKRAKAPRYRL